MNFPTSVTTFHFHSNFPTSAILSYFKRSFPTSLGSFQLQSVLSNFAWLFSTSDFPTFRSFQLRFPTKRIPIFWVIFGKSGIWSGFCFQKWQWVTHPRCNFFLNYQKLLRIDTHGFCFPKWRSMTLPNDLGFCFRKWRSVTNPDFSLCWTLTLNIFFWWRHTSDVTSCMYTLTSTLTTTYDVTVQL